MKAFQKTFAFNWPMAPVQLHSMLKFCGHECVTENYNWNGLKRGKKEFVLWQHTVSGEGRLIHEDKEYTMKSGDSMLVHIPHNHIYFLPENSSHWEFYFAGLSGNEIMRIECEFERLNGPVLNISADPTAENILKKTIELAGKNEIRNPVEASSIAYQMICALLLWMKPENESKSSCPESIRRAIELCLNSGQLHSVDEMAEAARMSRFHFSREFRNFTGMSPYEFVLDHVMRRASNLLQTGSYSVKEVAAMSGFSSESVFCRTFKRLYGSSPGSFLK